MIKNGIDVSQWQGKIDWSKVKTDFVIIRAGFGRFLAQKDSEFENNYNGCLENNIPCGAYWYSYALTPEDAEKEAKICIEVIKGKRFEYPIYMDIEESRQLALGREKCSAIAEAFMNTLEKAGYWAGLYSSKSHLESCFSEKIRERYAVWVAHYDVEKTDYSTQFGIWQKSSKGRKTGISGYVDLNECTVDYPQLMRNAKLNGFDSELSAIEKGRKIVLEKTPVYPSSETKNGILKSGVYYFYDGKLINGRYRITNSPENCGKQPVSEYVTGWIDAE